MSVAAVWLRESRQGVLARSMFELAGLSGQAQV